MNQFESFLNTLIKEGQELRGLTIDHINIDADWLEVCLLPLTIGDLQLDNVKYYSYNDLFFWPSWFMEAVKRKDSGEKKKTITINPSLPNCFDVLYDDIPDYHRIQLVLLKTDEERRQYVLDNSIQN